MSEIVELVGTGDVRRMTGVSERTLDRHVKAGTFPAPAAYVLGRRKWRRGDVERWIVQQTTAHRRSIAANLTGAEAR